MQTAAGHITRYVLPFAFCALALFIPFSISGANTAIILALLASIVTAIARPEARARYREIPRDPVFWGAAALVASALPAVFMSDDLPRALRDWKSYWLLLVYFLTTYNITGARLRRAIFWILFASMNISCLVAWIQYSGGLRLGVVEIAPETYRPGSTLYNMTFAGILYQVITVGFALALVERGPLRRSAVLLGGVILQTLTLLITLTRGAWLALFGGIAVVPVVLRKPRVLIAGVVMLGLAIGFAMAHPAFRDRASTIARSLQHPTDKNIATRFVLWDISWEIFRDHPLLGIGMGDYSSEAEARLAARRVTTTVDSHNIYLQILATRGVVGFIPFVAFWLILIRALLATRRRMEHDPFASHYIGGAVAATIAILIGALSENNIDDSEVFIAFMFIVGVARSYRWAPPAGDDAPPTG